MRTVVLTAVAMLPVAVTSCVSDECEGNKNSLPYAGFFSSELSPRAISVDSITVYGEGAPRDSLLIDNGEGVASVYLPFRIDGGESTFVIQYNQKRLRGLTDRITFRYETVPDFISAACGVVYDYHIDNIEHTKNLIDSVRCPGMVISNANEQNIRIYFRVSSTEEDAQQ